jgi:hypothetical protein
MIETGTRATIEEVLGSELVQGFLKGKQNALTDLKMVHERSQG